MSADKYYIISLTNPPPKSDTPETHMIDGRVILDKSLPAMACLLYTTLSALIDFNTNEIRMTAKQLAKLVGVFELEAVRFIKLLKKRGYIIVNEVKE